MWWNPTGFVAGDPSVQIHPSPVGDPGIAVRSRNAGTKWICLAMPLSREVVIDGIVLSYQMTNAASHIDLWRLVALGVPGQVAALFSDATILASLVPTQYQKQVGAIRPPNGLTLALRLKFQSPTHEIRIGTIALQLDPRRTLVDLATVGDAITLPAAQATLQQALLGVQSVGGGIVALTPGTAPDLTVRESKDGAAVLDVRGGPVRLQLAQQTEPISTSGSYPEGGLLVRHSTKTALRQLYGAYYPQAILQRTIHGASSVRTRVTRATGMGPDAQFYPESIENFFVGQSFDINDDGTKAYVVKSIGWDAILGEPYFKADVDQNVAPGALLGNKNDIGVLALTSEDHCSNQASALAIQKFAYGPGDAFGCTVSLNYLGNIMSTEGDEGGVGYGAEIVHDLRNFRGRVDTFDASTGRLKYVQGHNRAGSVCLSSFSGLISGMPAGFRPPRSATAG
jgi:hypothetical protein